MPHSLAWNDLEVLEKIGAGHSASVFRARVLRKSRDLDAGAHVAVKVYKRWLLEEPGFIERLFREVSAGQKVIHPSLIRIYGAVLNEDGQPALVTALCNGTNLEDELQRRRESNEPYSFVDANYLLTEVAGALALLHASGIIHRDVKPANVLLDNGRPILADFGVIKSGDLPEQTTTGAFLGTIRYSAPEYLFGDTYDHTIDVFSFGCVAYEVYANRQTLASEKHWAHLVAKKYAPIHANNWYCGGGPYSDVDLRQRFGRRAAYFVAVVLQHMACDHASRNLSLYGFTKAVEEQIWRESFVVDHDRLVIGPVVFSDNFGTSRKAFEELSVQLEPLEWARLLAILQEADEFKSSLLQRDDRINRRLLSRGVLARGEVVVEGLHAGYSTSITPSVQEAYTLGLFDPK